jgi:hypothetical protein
MKLTFPLVIFVHGLDSDIDCFYHFYFEEQECADYEFQEKLIINNLIEFIRVDWLDYLHYGYDEIETNVEDFFNQFDI